MLAKDNRLYNNGGAILFTIKVMVNLVKKLEGLKVRKLEGSKVERVSGYGPHPP